jgi:hypothetical protein
MPFKNPERSLTWPPGARTGEARIVVGSDTPDELTGLFEFAAAILFYVVDDATGLERGYFFIGNTNSNTVSANPALQYGEVQYPVMGNPHSATEANVKTNEVNIMMDNLIPLMRVFNLHISDIGGLTFQDGAFLGSIDSTFGTSNVDIAYPTQDVVGGIFRMATDAFMSFPADTRGLFMAAVMSVLSGGVINVDSGGSITGDVGSALDWDGTATFEDISVDDLTADDITANDMTLAGDIVTASQDGIDGQSATTSGTNDTTAAAYENMAGTGAVTSFTFVKRYTATRIKVTVHASFYSVTSVSNAKIGVRINGVDYDVIPSVPGIVNERQCWSATRFIAAGIAAGSYTVQLRWFRASGAGTIRRDNADLISVVAEEVAA